MATVTAKRKRVKAVAVAAEVKAVPCWRIPTRYTPGQLVKLYRMCKADPFGFTLEVVEPGWTCGQKYTPAGWLEWFRARFAEKMAHREEQAKPRRGNKLPGSTHGNALACLMAKKRGRFVIHPADLNGIRGERLRSVVSEWVSY